MSIVTTGFDKIMDAFDKIDFYRLKGLLAEASKLGADTHLAAAKAAVPVDTGALAASLRIRKGRNKVGSSHIVSMGKKNFSGAFFYGAFQEVGWKSGKRGSLNRKQIPGKHFMKESFDNVKGTALKKMEQHLFDGLMKEFKSDNK